MADDVENHTLRLLQEMRAEMREGFSRVDERLVSLEGRIESLEGRIHSLDRRIHSLEGRTQSLDEGIHSLERRMGSIETRQLSIEGSLAKVIDAVTEIAKVQEKHSGLLIELVESERITGSRLNAVEGRLARIEKHAGFVNA